MKALFWVSLLIIFYTYIGYPLLVFLISLCYKQPVRGKYVYPTVSIIISVYNEEKSIGNKILSLLQLDYPDERFEILIGSDGSNDKTNEILEAFQANRSAHHKIKIKTFISPKRSGKPTMLNLLIKQAAGEILIFSDARQKLEKNSIKELVKSFSDSSVGSVSAELNFEGKENKTGSGMGLYWEYEKFIRECESKIGSMLGATGALYAARRELVPALPINLILDDVYIPMTVVQKGYRAIFDPKAKIYDRFSINAREEFLRKTRTLAGNFQLFSYMNWLLNPFASPVAWQFISHKFLRLVVPFMLIALFISNFFELRNNFYLITFVLQIIFYSLALLGSMTRFSCRLFDIPRMFCVMNSAAVAGFYKFITNKQNVVWERIP